MRRNGTMAIFKCNVCGYLYDEAGNTLFSALPNDWRCPICGAEKAKFTKERLRNLKQKIYQKTILWRIQKSLRNMTLKMNRIWT